MCRIKEQIITDRASGLTLQFELDDDGRTHFRMFGSAIPFGNREIIFNAQGVEVATGTLVSGVSRPTWLTRLSDAA
jgi:hypothetical protein